MDIQVGYRGRDSTRFGFVSQSCDRTTISKKLSVLKVELKALILFGIRNSQHWQTFR
jgi:hypothetical protein